MTEQNKQKRPYSLRHPPRPNGIICPDCGAETLDSNPHDILATSPPQLRIHCPGCGKTGIRQITQR